MELGSTVTLIYKGTLDDGTLFGEATKDNPMVFQTGMDLAIDGFENEILKMNEVGETRKFKVDHKDAYGEYIPGQTQEIPLQQAPGGKIEVGQRAYVTDTETGIPMPVTAIAVEDGVATFDLNHPLAGKDLNFEVEIIGIEEPPENFISAKEKMRRMQAQDGPIDPLGELSKD